MSLHQIRESNSSQEQQLPLRQRMALFQSSPLAQESSIRGVAGGGTRKGRAETKISPSYHVETEIKPSTKPIQKTLLPTSYPSSSDTRRVHEIKTYHLSSHCDSLFSSLRELKEHEMLCDCSLQLSGKSHKAHRFVLATVSQKGKEWLCSKQMEVNLNNLGRSGCHVTSAGLNTVLSFAYYGEVDATYTEDRDLEEILMACRCLGAERLAQVCKSETPPTGRTQRETSLQVIRALWDSGVGCDIIMQAENGEQIPAHRVILAAGGDYFRALLCGGLRESNEEVVQMRGIAFSVLRSLLEFIYSGQLKLDWQNVWQLTEATMQFQLKGAHTLCLNFLQEYMDDYSCLDTLFVAETYGLKQLGRVAEEYVLLHFQRVSERENFKELSSTMLEHLLESDGISVDSEVVVFRALVNWIEEDKALRLDSLPGLLQKIRFPLMTPQELKEVQCCRLLCENAEGEKALEDVKKLLKGKEVKTECKSRVSNQVLVLVGGDSVNDNLERREPNQCLWFAQCFLRGEGLIRTIEWKTLSKLPEPPRLRHSVCVLNNILYILGGRKYYGKLDILKSVVRFNPALGKWECLPDMASPRDYFAAVCRGGKVFVLGGNHDDTSYLDSVEYYTPEDNTWRLAHPLDLPICGHAAAVLDGEIFVSGGCDSRLRCLRSLWHYDPDNGCSNRAPMECGAGRAGHVMLAVGNQLVVAGGLQPRQVGFGDQLQCEAYSVLWNCWTPLPLLPRPHLSPAATSIDGQLCVLGGSSADTARDTPWVYRYSPRENSWDKLGTMPRPYADLAACTLQLPIDLRG